MSPNSRFFSNLALAQTPGSDCDGIHWLHPQQDMVPIPTKNNIYTIYIYPCKCSQKCFLIPSFLPWFHLRCCIFRMILATKNWHQQMLLSVVGHFTGSMFDNEMAVKWSLQLWLSIIMSVVDWDYYHSYSLWYPYNPSILPMYYSITIWF